MTTKVLVRFNKQYGFVLRPLTDLSFISNKLIFQMPKSPDGDSVTWIKCFFWGKHNEVIDVFIWNYIILIYFNNSANLKKVWKSVWQMQSSGHDQWYTILLWNYITVELLLCDKRDLKVYWNQIIQTLLSRSRWFVNSIHWSNGCNRGLGTVILWVSVFLSAWCWLLV